MVSENFLLVFSKLKHFNIFNFQHKLRHTQDISSLQCVCAKVSPAGGIVVFSTSLVRSSLNENEHFNVIHYTVVS